MKQFFVLKLIPPRPTFAQDMSEAEREVMCRHGAYWTDLAEKGIALVFGPVLDPRNVWGLAIVEVSDEVEARALGANDPAVGLNTLEIHPMRVGGARK